MSVLKEKKVPLIGRIPESLKNEYMALCEALGVSMAGDMTVTIRDRVKSMREEIRQLEGETGVRKVDVYLK